ncbi:helix-turn-helix domain-containing protein [Floridanema evergladense]|uniref:Helix-turn-helix domain-containing protein n=1 Tax=Floridaenema evergladense BLCC-F167 TaxID=3153639 RepID=A0ABV4WP55_9CYAN
MRAPDFFTHASRLVCLLDQLLSEGWNQTTLAGAIGVSQPTINRWLAQKNLPEVNSNNFRALAKVSGGDARSLQLYLDGQISLNEYRRGVGVENATFASSHHNSEQIKAQILAAIPMLEPADIAEVISFSVKALTSHQA